MLARTGVSVEEDYPLEVIQRRATLNPIATRARRTKGYEQTKVVGDRLLVKGKPYTVDTVTKLPEAINPITHATRTNGDSTIFYTRYSKLSNHHPATFEVDDVTYRNTEQYYFSEMCKLGGDEEQSMKILAAKDPKTCQRLGRQARLRPDFDWKRHEENVMRQGCYAKFTQNNSCRNALLRTRESRLGESSRSTHWGTGMYSDHPQAFNTDVWENNLLGKVLTSVRRSIRMQMGNFND
jgi:ribA/ribD-fused uncharacterized protein